MSTVLTSSLHVHVCNAPRPEPQSVDRSQKAPPCVSLLRERPPALTLGAPLTPAAPKPQLAYVDAPLGIGYAATISAPHMHAYALELLLDRLRPGAKALDVGSGTGWGAAAGRCCMPQAARAVAAGRGCCGAMCWLQHMPAWCNASLPCASTSHAPSSITTPPPPPQLPDRRLCQAGEPRGRPRQGRRHRAHPRADSVGSLPPLHHTDASLPERHALLVARVRRGRHPCTPHRRG